jgi:F-type H+-transporting ATPase subunit delta
VEEIARVYAEALFDSAKDGGKLDEVHDQLAEFADAVGDDRDLQAFLFSPYFSTTEKVEGLNSAISGANEQFVNFLALLAEKHRMPAIFRIRDKFEELYAEETKRLEVNVTSAIPLDDRVVKQVGDEIEKQTGREVELSSTVDEDVLGGLVLRVGNVVLDASLRNKLEKMRREIARAA